jgi:hypothetical protein
MSGHKKKTKRPRTDQQEGAGASSDLPGRKQLLLTSPEMQTRLGRRFCDKSELLPLLLAHGLVRRVRTIQVGVRPLGGDSFKVTLDASAATVGQAKAEVARVQGTAESRQELYKLAERADGLAVREDDVEPELLEDESMVLRDGELVVMAVKDAPRMTWRTFPADRVTLSKGGAVATQTNDEGHSLTTTGIELREGRHYWEVKLLAADISCITIGITRPNLSPTGDYMDYSCMDGWFIYAANGALYGNGMEDDDEAGRYKKSDRVGVLLDLNNGSLRFFKNGVEHGPGFAAGSVKGPVVAAVGMYSEGDRVRLLPDATAPAGA